jgi:hypothetical protein
MGQGLWKFTDMPFGLCNATETFEQLVETVLKGPHKLCLVYQHVISIDCMIREHLDNLLKSSKVFERPT